MTTTIRTSRSGLESETRSYGVDLLERRGADFSSVQPEITETDAQTRERMRQNLERLMNFGREETAVAEETSAAVSVATATEEVSDSSLSGGIVDMSDEDIRPTSTTMQFGNDGKETVFKDMAKQKEESAYKLNGKGKLVVALYAIAVVVVLALIILNTGVLSVLSRMNSAKAETLAQKQGEVAALYEQIEEVSSDEYVIRVAEEELHMSLK